MFGVIAGDIVGSIYEGRPLRGGWNDFPLFGPRSHFTDDTVMSLAVAEAFMVSGNNEEAARKALIRFMHEYGRKYPHAGYGGKFRQWLQSPQSEPYNSFGNGSAMRVSAAGWGFDALADVEKMAAISAGVTHSHPEGIKGACSVAASIFMARKGESKEAIKNYVTRRFGYDLSRSLEKIRETYRFDVTCQGSVPEAITAFLESENFEQAIRKAIWLRGDADTQAAIAGSIAEAFYGGVPEEIKNETLTRLDDNLRAALARWQSWLENKK